MATPDAAENKVLGTIIFAERKKPFIYLPDEDRLELDFVYNPTQAPLPEAEAAEVERRVRAAADGEVVEVRIGQYHCYHCGEWFTLDGSSWSLGMCFNCSFDRSSEIADRYR